MRTGMAFVALAVVASAAAADVRLPRILSSHMVIQRDKPVRIWGWADNGEAVSVSFAGQTRSTTAGQDGTWQVELGPMAASAQGRELEVKGRGNSITLKDVLVGEVWLCGGQSNMEWAVWVTAQQHLARVQQPSLPAIRTIRVTASPSPTPREDFENGEWQPCHMHMTGLGYYFARELYLALNVPIGIIDVSVGGTLAETWTSRATLDQIPEAAEWLKYWDAKVAAYDLKEEQKALASKMAEYEKAVAAGKKDARKPELRRSPALDMNHPGNGYNAFVAPIRAFALRGVLFLQGENNYFVGNCRVYARTYPAVIQDWRAAWGDPDLPFGVIQMAGWGTAGAESPERAVSGEGAGGALIREVHLRTHLTTPHTGLIVTFDQGAADIHWWCKEQVGQRAAIWALIDVYRVLRSVRGDPIQEFPCLIYESVEKKEGRLIVHFRKAPVHELMSVGANREKLRGFVIAGADQHFYPAEARVRDNNSVEVWSSLVPDPMAVRYAWALNPEGNFFADRAVPASPFRTDDWSIGPGRERPFASDDPELKKKFEQAQREHSAILDQQARRRMRQEAERTLRDLGPESGGK